MAIYSRPMSRLLGRSWSRGGTQRQSQRQVGVPHDGRLRAVNNQTALGSMVRCADMQA